MINYMLRQKDKSFRGYLGVLSQDAENRSEKRSYQIPKDWLKELNTVNFNDMFAVMNLRMALSFKKVDYLVLAYEPDDLIYFVTSDPSALDLPKADTFDDSESFLLGS